MSYQWKLPDVGEGIHEAEIIRWLVKEGDTVETDQPILEMQTDKALVEIPSPVKGKIVKLHAAERDVVRVGTILVEFETNQQTPNSENQTTQTETAQTPASVSNQSQQTAPTPAKRALATPAIRRLARELGVDIQTVKGTGAGGRVTEEDVRSAVASQVSHPLKNTPPLADRQPFAYTSDREAEQLEERIPIQGIRRVIAEHMVRSKFTAPHVTSMEEVDVTELVKFRKKAADMASKKGIKFTYLPFVIKAVVSALKEYPFFNASIDDEKGQIVVKRYYNIGIAVDTPDGLIVPVIKQADRKSLLELADEISVLTEKATHRKLDVSDLQGGTFTISNIGSFGGYFATPVINHPEVAILATGTIARKPVILDDDSIIGRHLMPVSLTFDHRLIDGGMSGRFTKHIIQYLQDPTLMFLEMV
ncbi:dihydrolipoamide acetyltransferase family protein [Effusibacillus dendaii]|uniref:Dihydrolipoamide acetyltransferase component of pyruvate dehydrogenase complex n=1 Tax=Effusibacillus dendaii TaxID=2743772 RepID=A0A7I8DAB4_9BACL|nr:dihydrolipoamide acetyltransferase family protein [Effusibacillus dendaii]BCJ85470.1 dihydrolipoyllysine-residue acetyltransferase component of pyruvate dehydrogenase complex [Effusibacillus dendaii]